MYYYLEHNKRLKHNKFNPPPHPDKITRTMGLLNPKIF